MSLQLAQSSVESMDELNSSTEEVDSTIIVIVESESSEETVYDDGDDSGVGTLVATPILLAACLVLVSGTL